jgi:hypothetical protein
MELGIGTALPFTETSSTKHQAGFSRLENAVAENGPAAVPVKI